VDVERLDTASECDDLVPSNVPAPVSVGAQSSGSSCFRAISDGTGHVAAAVNIGASGVQWQSFGPDGHPGQKFSLSDTPWPQPEGWQGLLFQTGKQPDVLTFFADGTPRHAESPRPTTFQPTFFQDVQDPRGGLLLVETGPAIGGAGGPPCLGEARRFDATGAPVGTPGTVGCGVSSTGVSNAGEALIRETSSTGFLVRWLRDDGGPAAPPGVDPDQTFGQLRPLLDGSLVVWNPTSYLRRYPHLATASENAPPWLAARGGQTFQFTRGNRGYAFFPPAFQNSANCTQVVELVAPSGRRCAKLTFRRDGNACVTGFIDQGWDGTVVQQTSSGACGWRFWPGLLAGG
jgi:hypothetical protein